MDSNDKESIRMEVKLINKFRDKIEDDSVPTEEKVELIESMKDNGYIGKIRASELIEQVKEDS